LKTEPTVVATQAQDISCFGSSAATSHGPARFGTQPTVPLMGQPSGFFTFGFAHPSTAQIVHKLNLMVNMGTCDSFQTATKREDNPSKVYEARSVNFRNEAVCMIGPRCFKAADRKTHSNGDTVIRRFTLIQQSETRFTITRLPQQSLVSKALM
jgi:hypothetical protein